MKHTVNTKLVKRLSNLDLGVEVEVGIGKLLAFTECALCRVSISALLYLCL